MKIEISRSLAIQLRAVLNTSGKDLEEIAYRIDKKLPMYAQRYHEWKGHELRRLGKIIDKKIKKYDEQRSD